MIFLFAKKGGKEEFRRWRWSILFGEVESEITRRYLQWSCPETRTQARVWRNGQCWSSSFMGIQCNTGWELEEKGMDSDEKNKTIKKKHQLRRKEPVTQSYYSEGTMESQARAGPREEKEAVVLGEGRHSQVVMRCFRYWLHLVGFVLSGRGLTQVAMNGRLNAFIKGC